MSRGDFMSRRWEPECREALKQRQTWCEGTFAMSTDPFCPKEYSYITINSLKRQQAKHPLSLIW